MGRARRRTWILAVTPVVVAAGFVARPYVSDFTDNDALAAVIVDNTGRWTAAAVLMVVGAALLAFALPAGVARVGGGERHGRWVRPASTIGAVLFALHVGLVGLGGATASQIGADVPEFLNSASLEGAVLSVGLLALAVAWVGVIRAVRTSDLSTSMQWLAVVGGALGALGHLYPSSAGEYIASVGTAAALWPLAAHQPADEIA